MRSFSKKEALTFGWRRFKERPFFLIGLLLITFAVSAITGFVADEVSTDGMALIFGLLDSIVQIILGMGMTLILLRVYDQVDTDYGDLIEPLHLFWKYLVVSILIAAVVFVGLAILVIPGIIAAIALMFARYLVIDRNLGPVEALTTSLHITHGHRWNLFIFGMVLFLLNIVGMLFFGVGLLITVPISLLATVHVYRWLLDPPEDGGVEVSMFAKILTTTVLAVFVGAITFVMVLLALGASSVSGSPEARDIQRRADILEVQLGAALYRDVNGTFPTSIEQMIPEYLDYLPLDPSTGEVYNYTVYTNGDDYEVCAVLEATETPGELYCEFGYDLTAEDAQFQEDIDDVLLEN